jgi:uncharacterized protein YbaR (Trm112 family)
MLSFGYRELLRFSLPWCRLKSALERLSMALSQDLLDILACPACKSPVELKPDGSGLKCVACKRVYPIRDDIPVMLIDEATMEDSNQDEEPAGHR